MTSPTTLTPAPPAAPGSQQPSSSGGLAKIGNSDVSADTFLQLLVAEIKNQDPLQPMQGTEFITQLAQFNSLAQLIAIKDELQPASPPSAPAGAAAGGSTAGATSAAGGAAPSAGVGAASAGTAAGGAAAGVASATGAAAAGLVGAVLPEATSGAPLAAVSGTPLASLISGARSNTK